MRYWHTIRYLKPVQIYGRLWYRLVRPKPDLRPAPALSEASGIWKRCARKPSMLGASVFRFLSVTRELSAATDWNRQDWPKLWLYNLHYFDDLNADDAALRVAWHRALMARWIAENPSAAGNGWEPYPLSLRLVNWVKWAAAGNALESDVVQSIAVQARWLMGRLEWHLLGNHLLANAKALVFAGTFFAGPEADGWRDKGLAILRREHAEQILDDGGHFERSPMYHAIILEDLLDLIQLAVLWPGVVDAALVAEWSQKATRMLHWLAEMTHPDGGIALFNDAAFGIAPDPAALAVYAAALEIPKPQDLSSVTLLAESGYARMQQGEAVLIADVGEIGPDYLPGHAHADTLSFELSVFEQRVVVNSGTSEYGLGAERLRQRGTAAHSTVQIAGADSSEVWSGFRVARRARPVGLSVSEDEDVVKVACAHDGYRRLPGRPLHRRTWRMTAHGLQVSDAIEGGFEEAVARYHLHPAVSVSGEGGDGVLRLPDGHTMRWAVTGGSARLVASTWHPEFGRSIASTCIELVFEGPQATMEFFWD
ncbi:MAG: alginate lyase family protein [Rhodocyclales bacterium]|nr:alginate lyase family protein [Rhodocyclales bacterium]